MLDKFCGEEKNIFGNFQQLFFAIFLSLKSKFCKSLVNFQVWITQEPLAVKTLIKFLWGSSDDDANYGVDDNADNDVEDDVEDDV